MKRVLLVTAAVLTGTLAHAQDTEQAGSPTQTFDYWTTLTYDEDTPGAEAHTWVGAQDGPLGPTKAEADALLTIYFTPMDDGTCAAAIEVKINEHIPTFEYIELQVDSREPHLMNLVDQDLEAASMRALVIDNYVEPALNDFRPGSVATVRVNGWQVDEVLATYLFPLYGYIASTEAALAVCEADAAASQ